MMLKRFMGFRGTEEIIDEIHFFKQSLGLPFNEIIRICVLSYT